MTTTQPLQPLHLHANSDPPNATTIIPFHIHSYLILPLLYTVLLIGSSIPTSSSSTAITTFRSLLITSLLLLICLQIPRSRSGHTDQDFVVALASVWFLIHWSDLFVLWAGRDWTRIGDWKKAEKDEEGKKERRSWWAEIRRRMDLCASMRGVGWDWEVKNIPKVKLKDGRGKLSFIKQQLFRAIRSYILFDICISLPQLLLSFNASRPAQDSILTPVNSIAALVPDLLHPPQSMPPITYLLLIWTPPLASYHGLRMEYSLLSIISVLLTTLLSYLNLTPSSSSSSFSTWPPLFGPLSSITSVRSTWGTFWHQLFRRTLNFPFSVLERYSRVPPTAGRRSSCCSWSLREGTWRRRYLQLYLAFGTSAAIHHLGAMNCARGTKEVNLLQVKFFLLQPLAITVEDVVVAMGKHWLDVNSGSGAKREKSVGEENGLEDEKKRRMRIARLGRLVGRMWTFVWFSWSMRYMSQFQYEIGMMDTKVGPSWVEFVLRRWKLAAEE